jgi:hypothetical protein
MPGLGVTLAPRGLANHLQRGRSCIVFIVCLYWNATVICDFWSPGTSCEIGY